MIPLVWGGQLNKNLNELVKNLTISELKELSICLKNNKKKKIIKEIEKITKKRKTSRKLDINYRFKLDMISTFSLEDRKVLEKNNIKNMLDLIEADISSLEGIDSITKESLEWAQNFYDLRKIRVKKNERKQDYSSCFNKL